MTQRNPSSTVSIPSETRLPAPGRLGGFGNTTLGAVIIASISAVIFFFIGTYLARRIIVARFRRILLENVQSGVISPQEAARQLEERRRRRMAAPRGGFGWGARGGWGAWPMLAEELEERLKKLEFPLEIPVLWEIYLPKELDIGHLGGNNCKWIDLLPISVSIPRVCRDESKLLLGNKPPATFFNPLSWKPPHKRYKVDTAPGEIFKPRSTREIDAVFLISMPSLHLTPGGSSPINIIAEKSGFPWVLSQQRVAEQRLVLGTTANALRYQEDIFNSISPLGGKKLSL